MKRARLLPFLLLTACGSNDLVEVDTTASAFSVSGPWRCLERQGDVTRVLAKVRCDPTDTNDPACNVQFSIDNLGHGTHAVITGASTVQVPVGPEVVTVPVEVTSTLAPSNRIFHHLKARVLNCGPSGLNCLQTVAPLELIPSWMMYCPGYGSPYVNAADQEPVYTYDPSAGTLDIHTLYANGQNVAGLFSEPGFGTNWEVHLADLDGDGRDEVFRYHASSGTGVVLRFNSNRTSYVQTHSSSWFGSHREIHIGDFNGDGVEEIFSYHPTFGHAIITTFDPSLQTIAQPYSKSGWGAFKQIHVGDFDGTGSDEILRHDFSSGDFVVTRISGGLNGTSNPVSGNFGANVQPFVADLDGDGADDVFRYHASVGRVITTRFPGLSSQDDTYDSTGWGNNWRMYFADIDADGAKEVVRHQQSTGRLMVTHFDPGIVSPYTTYDSPNGWGNSSWYFSVADATGAGFDRLVRYNVATGHMIMTRFSGNGSAFHNTYNDPVEWYPGKQVFTENVSYYLGY